MNSAVAIGCFILARITFVSIATGGQCGTVLHRCTQAQCARVSLAAYTAPMCRGVCARVCVYACMCVWCACVCVCMDVCACGVCVCEGTHVR